MTAKLTETGTPAADGRRHLLVVGNIPVDLVLSLPELPTTGSDLLADSASLLPGGAFNVVYAARQAELATSYAGGHGRGAFGDLIRAALAQIGCRVLQPVTQDRDSGVVLALVDSGGERTFVTSPEAVFPCTPGMLAGLPTSPTDLVYVSGYSLGLGASSLALAGWTAELPEEHLVCCDLGPRGATAGPAVLESVLARVDWLACNAAEATRLTMKAEPNAACEALRRRTRQAGVLVRVGASGCWLAMPGQQPKLVPASEVETVVDTNGAGDTHTGFFLAGLAEGRTAREAVELANRAAAISVTKRGPATAPARAELA